MCGLALALDVGATKAGSGRLAVIKARSTGRRERERGWSDAEVRGVYRGCLSIYYESEPRRLYNARGLDVV